MTEFMDGQDLRDESQSKKSVTLSNEIPRQPEDAIKKVSDFLSQEAPYLGKLTGMDAEFKVGDTWATNMKTGEIIIDPNFFIERGYTSEHATYATLHELWAHLRDIRRDPSFAARQMKFSQKGQSEGFFNNVLADIYGNKLMHHVLPTMSNTANELYTTKLFESDDLANTVDQNGNNHPTPLHMQFLYKMLLDEMAPNNNKTVRPEVEEALSKLRNYKGAGDAIKYLTDPNSKMSSKERFDQQLAIIYPIYQELLEQSKKENQQDKEQHDDQSDSNDNHENNKSDDTSQPGDQSQEKSEENQPNNKDGADESQHQDNQTDNNEQKNNDGNKSDQKTGGQPDADANSDNNNPFKDAYKDYFENKHPRPLDDEDQKKAILDSINHQNETDVKPIDPQNELDKQLRKETGFGLLDHNKYKEKVIEYSEQIDRMREVFRSIINERLALKRGLSRQAYSEGAILDPNKLAQVIADTKSGVLQPEAYQQYEAKRGRAETVGNTDYIFVFDKSGSMSGDKAKTAAISALIMLEGLAAVERDVKKAESDYNLDLELNIRTALYTFNNEGACLKPLGEDLSSRERLSIQKEIISADGSTNDYLVLEEIAKITIDPGQRRIIIVVSDGESSDPARANAIIRRLRSNGAYVYGIGIGSDDATRLYQPNTKRVDNPNDLPDALEHFIEETIG